MPVGFNVTGPDDVTIGGTGGATFTAQFDAAYLAPGWDGVVHWRWSGSSTSSATSPLSGTNSGYPSTTVVTLTLAGLTNSDAGREATIEFAFEPFPAAVSYFGGPAVLLANPSGGSPGPSIPGGVLEMRYQRFTNNASAKLAIDVGDTDLTITLEAGAGAAFPVLGPGEIFKVALRDVSDGRVEIMNVTARGGDVLTVERGREGTSAQSFSTKNTLVAHQVTAEVLDYLQDFLA